jgi:soluble lytic murein transglycosylase
MDGVARRSRRPAAGGAHHAPGRRVVVTITVLAVLVFGLLAAWLTISDWYRTWMPSSVGRLGLPLHYVQDIRSAAQRNRLDPALVAAVIYAESHFDQSVRSRSGAVGLMQVMPATAQEIAHKSGGITFVTSDLDTPRINILYGCFYLRRLEDQFHGSIVETLAAYNAGAANVEQWVAARGHTLRVADIPFGETQTYVKRVLSLRTIYRHIYGAQLGSV